MSDDADIDRFVKDPSLLVELCREVIEHLDASSEDSAVAEQEAQLRAIAKAVEQLEKSGVTVPDPLRAEKTRLAASLAMHTDAKQALAQLADEFQDILRDLRDRLGQNTATALPEAKLRGRRSKLPKTPQKVLREHIVRALKNLNGKARVPDVIEEMGRQLDGKLLPGDTVWREAANE
jgi:outer membrane protein TolC